MFHFWRNFRCLLKKLNKEIEKDGNNPKNSCDPVNQPRSSSSNDYEEKESTFKPKNGVGFSIKVGFRKNSDVGQKHNQGGNLNGDEKQ